MAALASSYRRVEGGPKGMSGVPRAPWEHEAQAMDRLWEALGFGCGLGTFCWLEAHLPTGRRACLM